MTEADHTANDTSSLNRREPLITALRQRIESILRLLRNTDQPTLSYVWKAWLVGLIPSVLIGTIMSSILAVVGYEDKFPDVPLLFFLIAGVLIAPWVETVLMGWGLAILKRIIKGTIWVCLASGVIWGVLHGVQPGFALGLPAAWLFFVMSICFMEWEKKSRAKAIKVTALIHMCQNGLAFALVLLFVLLGAESPEAKKAPPSPSTHQKAGPVSFEKSQAVASALAAQKTEDLSEEARRTAFKKHFPQFGLEEYMLANEDLYPDWKKNLAPNSTWKEFLLVYKDFVTWRAGKGSPPEAEYTVWKDFLAQRKPAKSLEEESPLQRSQAQPGNETRK